MPQALWFGLTFGIFTAGGFLTQIQRRRSSPLEPGGMRPASSRPKEECPFLVPGAPSTDCESLGVNTGDRAVCGPSQLLQPDLCSRGGAASSKFRAINDLARRAVVFVVAEALDAEAKINDHFWDARKNLTDTEKQMLGFEIYGDEGRHYAFKGIVGNLRIKLEERYAASTQASE